MKVMILCGGQGSRLRELTELRPKPMVEIGGFPIVWHIMKSYSHFGHNDFILCLGYKAWVIKEYFLNYQTMNCDFTVHLNRNVEVEMYAPPKEAEPWRVTLAYTGEQTMTGGRIRRASKYLDANSEPFLMTYGDGVSDVDIHELLKFHRSHGKLATLTGVRPPSRYGALELKDQSVVRFREKPKEGEGLVNGGFFVFERGFLNYLSDADDCVLERGPLERCAQEGQLQVFQHSGYWQCMDTYRDWQGLEDSWRCGAAPWKTWK